jgi:hypothetical protein
VSGKMIEQMDLEFTFKILEQGMKGHGRMIIKMEKEKKLV